MFMSSDRKALLFVFITILIDHHNDLIQLRKNIKR